MSLEANVVASQNLIIAKEALENTSDAHGNLGIYGENGAELPSSDLDLEEKRSAQGTVDHPQKLAPEIRITIDHQKDAKSEPQVQKTVHYELDDKERDPRFNWIKSEDDQEMTPFEHEKDNDYEKLNICECCDCWQRMNKWKKGLLVIVILCVVFGTPGLIVYLLGYGNSTRFLGIRIDMWSVWAGCVFCGFGIVYFLTLLVLALFQLSRVMSRSYYLRMAVSLRTNITFCLSCCFNFASFCVLTLLFENCSYSMSCTSAGWMFPVLLCIFISSIAFLIEQYLVKSAAINFHQYAYSDRISALQFGEWVLDYLSKKKKKQRAELCKNVQGSRRGTFSLPKLVNPLSPSTTTSSASQASPQTLTSAQVVSVQNPLCATPIVSDNDPSLPPASQFLAAERDDADKWLPRWQFSKFRHQRPKRSWLQLTRLRMASLASPPTENTDPLAELGIKNVSSDGSERSIEQKSLFSEQSSYLDSLSDTIGFYATEASLRLSEDDRSAPKNSDNQSAVNVVGVRQRKRAANAAHKPQTPTALLDNAALTATFKSIKKKIRDTNMLESISNPIEAARLAKKNFEFLANGKEYIEASDLEPHFSVKRRQAVLKLFDQNGNGIISKREFRAAVLQLYKERLVLAHSLMSTKDSLSKLDNIFIIITIIILVFIWLAIFNYNVYSLFLTMASIIVPVTFMIGNSAKTLFEAVIFLFVNHPFDVGDKVQIDNEHYVVLHIHILTTWFTRLTDGIQVTMPNAILSNKTISNYRRSTPK